MFSPSGSKCSTLSYRLWSKIQGRLGGPPNDRENRCRDGHKSGHLNNVKRDGRNAIDGHSTITSLPVDINLLILMHLSTPADVLSITKASPVHFAIYKDNKRYILERILFRRFCLSNLRLAIAVTELRPNLSTAVEGEASTSTINSHQDILRRSSTIENIYLFEYKTQLVEIRHHVVDPGTLTLLSRLWMMIDYFIKMYSEEVLAKLDLAQICIGFRSAVGEELLFRHELSEEEYMRIQRAFLLLELFRGHVSDLRLIHKPSPDYRPSRDVGYERWYYPVGNKKCLAYYLNKSESMELYSAYYYLSRRLEDSYIAICKNMEQFLSQDRDKQTTHSKNISRRLQHTRLIQKILDDRQRRFPMNVQFTIHCGLASCKKFLQRDIVNQMNLFEKVEESECKQVLDGWLRCQMHDYSFRYRPHPCDDSDELSMPSAGYKIFPDEDQISVHEEDFSTMHRLVAIGFFFWDRVRLFPIFSDFEWLIRDPMLWGMYGVRQIISKEQVSLEIEILKVLLPFRLNTSPQYLQ